MVQGSPAYKEDKYSRTPINRRRPLTVQTRIVHGLRFRVAAPQLLAHDGYIFMAGTAVKAVCVRTPSSPFDSATGSRV